MTTINDDVLSGTQDPNKIADVNQIDTAPLTKAVTDPGIDLSGNAKAVQDFQGIDLTGLSSGITAKPAVDTKPLLDNTLNAGNADTSKLVSGIQAGPAVDTKPLIDNVSAPGIDTKPLVQDALKAPAFDEKAAADKALQPGSFDTKALTDKVLNADQIDTKPLAMDAINSAKIDLSFMDINQSEFQAKADAYATSMIGVTGQNLLKAMQGDDPIARQQFNIAMSRMGLSSAQEAAALAMKIKSVPGLEGSGAGNAMVSMLARDQNAKLDDVVGQLSIASTQRISDLNKWGFEQSFTIQKTLQDMQHESLMDKISKMQEVQSWNQNEFNLAADKFNIGEKFNSDSINKAITLRDAAQAFNNDELKTRLQNLDTVRTVNSDIYNAAVARLGLANDQNKTDLDRAVTILNTGLNYNASELKDNVDRLNAIESSNQNQFNLANDKLQAGVQYNKDDLAQLVTKLSAGQNFNANQLQQEVTKLNTLGKFNADTLATAISRLNAAQTYNSTEIDTEAKKLKDAQDIAAGNLTLKSDAANVEADQLKNQLTKIQAIQNLKDYDALGQALQGFADQNLPGLGITINLENLREQDPTVMASYQIQQGILNDYLNSGDAAGAKAQFESMQKTYPGLMGNQTLPDSVFDKKVFDANQALTSTYSENMRTAVLQSDRTTFDKNLDQWFTTNNVNPDTYASGLAIADINRMRAYNGQDPISTIAGMDKNQLAHDYKYFEMEQASGKDPTGAVKTMFMQDPAIKKMATDPDRAKALDSFVRDVVYGGKVIFDPKTGLPTVSDPNVLPWKSDTTSQLWTDWPEANFNSDGSFTTTYQGGSFYDPSTDFENPTTEIGKQNKTLNDKYENYLMSTPATTDIPAVAEVKDSTGKVTTPASPAKTVQRLSRQEWYYKSRGGTVDPNNPNPAPPPKAVAPAKPLSIQEIMKSTIDKVPKLITPTPSIKPPNTNPTIPTIPSPGGSGPIMPGTIRPSTGSGPMIPTFNAGIGRF